MMRKKRSTKIDLCIAILLSFFGFISCTDNIDTDLEMAGTCGVTFINAIPQNNSVNLFINDTLFNPLPLAFAAKTADYLTAPVGTKQLTVRNSANDEVIIQQPVFLKPDQLFTLFAAGKPSSDSLIYVAVSDYVEASSKEYAKVRFINMVPDTMRLSLLTLFSTDTAKATTFSNASFKSVSSFSQLKIGDYKFEVVRSGDKSSVVTPYNIKLEPKAAYTIWVSGLPNAASEYAIKTHTIQNIATITR